MVQEQQLDDTAITMTRKSLLRSNHAKERFQFSSPHRGQSVLYDQMVASVPTTDYSTFVSRQNRGAIARSCERKAAGTELRRSKKLDLIVMAVGREFDS